MSDYKFIMYLDLDGVLTSDDYIEYIHKSFIEYEGQDEFHYRNFMHKYCFQYEGIECLNKLYDKFPYEIVLTSTRRFEFTIDEWNFIFKLNRLKPEIRGRVSKFAFDKDKFTWREDEIYKYHFHESPASFRELPFIIIDDDTFDLMKYKDKLIHVKTETGLTLNNYNEIIDKLKIQGVDLNENT